MTSNVLCKYFMNGACAYGDQCRFSHNRSSEPSQVCKYYLQGNCAYGDRCRYMHSKPSWSARGQPPPQSSYAPPTGVPRPRPGPGPAAAGTSPGLAKLPSGSSELGLAESAPNWEEFMTPDEMDEFENWQLEQQAAAAAGGEYEGGAGAGGNGSGAGDIVDPADIPLCAEYAASGYCSAGDECAYIHGDPCEVCEQYALHPYDQAAAAAHASECAANAARLAKRLADGAIECGICLERVLSKRELSGRRFGLLPGCDHAFCLACIRSWRATGEVDKDTALRTCPVCRVSSHFVTPSTRWPDSAEEKGAIIGAYKARMADKDCAHFAFGEGSCPFGTSCFYKHAYRDGRLEEVHLRRAGTADGGVKVIGPVMLSSFLDGVAAQAALSRRPGLGAALVQHAQAGRGGRRRVVASAAAAAGSSAAAQQDEQDEQQQQQQQQEEDELQEREHAGEQPQSEPE